MDNFYERQHPSPMSLFTSLQFYIQHLTNTPFYPSVSLVFVHLSNARYDKTQTEIYSFGSINKTHFAAVPCVFTLAYKGTE